MLAGIDAASAFGGIGTSREMMMSALAEPGLFVTLFVVSLTLGGTNLTGLVGAAAQSGVVLSAQHALRLDRASSSSSSLRLGGCPSTTLPPTWS